MQKDIDKYSDEKIIKLALKENKELFSVVIERYRQKLVNYSYYITNDWESAEDIVTDVFIKVGKNLEKFDLNKKFSTWIYKIVHNQTISHLRKKKKEVSLTKNEWLDKIPSEGDVEDDLNKKQTKELLHSCLKSLPEVYRPPLALSYLENKSYKEISKVLGISEGTVASRINRGKRMMKGLCLHDPSIKKAYDTIKGKSDQKD